MLHSLSLVDLNHATNCSQIMLLFFYPAISLHTA